MVINLNGINKLKIIFKYKNYLEVDADLIASAFDLHDNQFGYMNRLGPGIKFLEENESEGFVGDSFIVDSFELSADYDFIKFFVSMYNRPVHKKEENIFLRIVHFIFPKKKQQQDDFHVLSELIDPELIVIDEDNSKEIIHLKLNDFLNLNKTSEEVVVIRRKYSLGCLELKTMAS